MLVFDVWCTLNGILFANVLFDGNNLLWRIAKRLQAERHRTIQDLEHTATGQLLVLD